VEVPGRLPPSARWNRTRVVTLRIATRGSALALVQARWVADRLRESDPGRASEILTITTQGDRRPDTPLVEIGGKIAFVKEIEEALLDGRADVAVHSLKDVPGELPAGLVLAAFPPRADARDALVLPAGPGNARGEVFGPASPLPLAAGARVGNSSLRRRAQLLRVRPDLRVEPIRGNVDTRLRKLDGGEFDALVLAAAALGRMGLEARISGVFSPEVMVPAPGQGALALECRAASRWHDLVGSLDDAATRAAVVAERVVMTRLGGGCLAPLGVHATLAAGRLAIVARLLAPDGTAALTERAAGPVAESEALAARVAERLLAKGGAELIAVSQPER
jgi:hydroxymethylbilane synthase